ncbi:glycosyltransferase family 2 protein [Salinibius halmophilus]|uniref:glycosyltransferase family 2 protein n=1 Tax=Salinibius halmophilus TaxID=1853216 RepID=UPI000E6709A2|nr:glycosyltransferase family 2 protein [Salinibius halmophilus]
MILVSVVTPVFNSEKYIRETYESLLNQTHESWEWIVVDDCSTDCSYDLLNEIKSNDHRVRLMSTGSNSGAAVSRNLALDRAAGDYVAFLDSDDLWRPSKLKDQVEFMESQHLDFSFTSYEVIFDDGRSTGKTVDRSAPSVGYNDMLKKRATLGCSTVMLSKKVYKEYKMPLLRTGQDYALWLSILKNGYIASPILKALTLYRISENSISRNKFKKALRQWSIYRENEGIGLFSALFYFSHYAFRAVFRS